MSQGLVIRKGSENPSEMDVLQGTFTCECKCEFLIYHHRAYPEDIAEQIGWLKAELDREHKNGADHRDRYELPINLLYPQKPSSPPQ